MKYTLNIPVSGNNYDILFGYHLTSWNDGTNDLYKFWVVPKESISSVNDNYSISPEIETANVSVPQVDMTSETYNINMECVDNVYGVKCKWYAICLCTQSAEDIPYDDKVKGNFNDAQAYWGDVTLQKEPSTSFYYYDSMKVESNIKGLILKDLNSIFSGYESITVQDLVFTRTTGETTTFSVVDDVTFAISGNYLICNDELIFESNKKWSTEYKLGNVTCSFTYNGNQYTDSDVSVDFIAVKMIPLKSIFNSIVSEEPDEYSIAVSNNANNTFRGYLPSNPGATPITQDGVQITFGTIYSNNSSTYTWTNLKSFSYRYEGEDTLPLDEVDTLPDYPLLFCVDINGNPAILSIDSDVDFGVGKIVGPINPDSTRLEALRHATIGKYGRAESNNRTNNRF